MMYWTRNIPEKRKNLTNWRSVS
ncbi:hypothetical protein AHF37_09282 [Paragonimus kellicotti]|nr:hypothetical protein AHF37_09282 [Paragonimus kellicotti]